MYALKVGYLLKEKTHNPFRFTVNKSGVLSPTSLQFDEETFWFCKLINDYIMEQIELGHRVSVRDVRDFPNVGLSKIVINHSLEEERVFIFSKDEKIKEIAASYNWNTKEAIFDGKVVHPPVLSNTYELYPGVIEGFDMDSELFSQALNLIDKRFNSDKRLVYSVGDESIVIKSVGGEKLLKLQKYYDTQSIELWIEESVHPLVEMFGHKITEIKNLEILLDYIGEGLDKFLAKEIARESADISKEPTAYVLRKISSGNIYNGSALNVDNRWVIQAYTDTDHEVSLSVSDTKVSSDTSGSQLIFEEGQFSNLVHTRAIDLVEFITKELKRFSYINLRIDREGRDLALVVAQQTYIDDYESREINEVYLGKLIDLRNKNEVLLEGFAGYQEVRLNLEIASDKDIEEINEHLAERVYYIASTL